MKKSRGLSNIKTILQNAFRRLGLSLRRFGRRGGIGGAIGRLALGVKRRDKRTITSLCAFLGCLVLLIAGISVISANRPQQSMQGVITSSAGIVDLTGDYENVQADREAKELAAGPTPKPLYFQQGFEDENIAEIQQRLMDLGYMDNDEPTRRRRWKYSSASTALR